MGRVSFSLLKAKKDKGSYMVSHRMADKVRTENLQPLLVLKFKPV